MAKTIEKGSNPFYEWAGNATALPVEWIKPMFSTALIYKDIGMQWNLGRIDFGRDETTSLFYNSMFYVRLMFPMWIGFQFRWSGSDPRKKEYLQLGIGWKLNGRFAVLARVQSDDNSALGVQGPNYGQSNGFIYGTK